LKPKLVWIIFKNSVRTAKKTQHFTVTKISWCSRPFLSKVPDSVLAVDSFWYRRMQ
jgi:hypothetical protein